MHYNNIIWKDSNRLKYNAQVLNTLSWKAIKLPVETMTVKEQIYELGVLASTHKYPYTLLVQNDHVLKSRSSVLWMFRSRQLVSSTRFAMRWGTCIQRSNWCGAQLKSCLCLKVEFPNVTRELLWFLWMSWKSTGASRLEAWEYPAHHQGVDRSTVTRTLFQLKWLRDQLTAWPARIVISWSPNWRTSV